MFEEEKIYHLSSVIDAIKPYDPIDCLSKIGALQLCPENANHAIRLEALGHAINCVTYEANKPTLTRHRLDRILNEPPLGKSDFESQEDPTPNAFTEAITFYGGSYIVFPGQLNDPTFIVKHLLAAIFLEKKFEAHREFQNKIYRMTVCLLKVSDEIARRAKLARNMAPRPISRSIFIPADIDKFKRTVVFSKQELDEILIPLGCDHSALIPFIQPFGQLDSGSYSYENSPLHTRPIIQFRDSFIISEPWILLASLRHHILLTAKKFDALELLFEEYDRAIIHSVGSSLVRIGHRQIPFVLNHPDGQIKLSQSTWSLDTDKVLYVAVTTDNFTDYVGDDLFKDQTKPDIGEILDKHLTEVEKQIREAATNLGDIFYLIITAGVGRSQFIGMQLDKLMKEPVALILSAADLETVSLLDSSDSLDLYKFAKAQQSIRKLSRIFSWSPLDEFELYRKNQYSFYFDDGPRPKLINIASGSARELKIEVLEKLDIHGVPAFWSASWIEAANAHHIRSCPIYTPHNFNPHIIAMFVELVPTSFWVIAINEVNEFEKLPGKPNPGNFVDLFSYWIWQFSEGLSKSLVEADFDYPIVFEVIVVEDEEWIKDADINRDNPPLTTTIISEYKMQISIRPEIIGMLNTADNNGELQAIRLVFEGFCDLLKSFGRKELSDKLLQLIPQFIEEQKAYPRKKKIFTINPSFTPSLLPGNHLPFRKVQDADTSELLDDAGKYLLSERHVAVGKIPKDQHVEILNSIVTFYFNKLINIISSLNSDGLLDFLVTHYEGIIVERTIRQITIATQLACFSTTQELIQQLSKQPPEIDDAAISCRFLIEYVVSQPPSGENPISLVVYDQMMALASEIISRGNQSDFTKYGLFDFDFELLASGRLGFNRSQFNMRINTYQNARSKGEIHEASENFTRWWRKKDQLTPDDSPPHVKNLDQAFEAEFGLALTDVSQFIAKLGDMSIEMNSSDYKTMELNALVNETAAILGWGSEKVLSIIKFLSLSPREKFLSPPHPYKNTDIYPWRMGRGLSYLRRPLLFCVKQNQTTVCWGIRHLFTSFDYLSQATVSGRLQDEFRSKEMREFLGKNHSLEGDQFNERVYEAIACRTGVSVKKKVKKICGKRIGYPGSDLGDLDVFAIFPKSRKLAIIECKDLEIARNAIEMSRELNALFIDDGKRESTITKHRKRVNWIRSNLAMVLESFGIKDIRKWRIEPLLVVNSEMITTYFHDPLIPVLSFSQFVSHYLDQNS